MPSLNIIFATRLRRRTLDWGMNILSHERKKERWTFSGLLLVVLVLAVGCRSGDASSPPGRKELKASAILPSNQNNWPTTSDDLVVYLDVSEPMRNYVLPDGQSVFSQTLRTLREFSAIQSIPVRVHLRTIAKQVGPPQPNAALADAAFSQKIYNGSESNLVSAIICFNQNLPSGVSGQAQTTSSVKSLTSPVPVKDEALAVAGGESKGAAVMSVKPPRFHVLVTDGVQYAARTDGGDGCASGTDAFCVRQKIRALLDQGWAGSVLALRSEYCCAFFSENEQKWIGFDTKSLPPSNYRPFYLFIFSPDHKAVDEFVLSLKESLRKSINPMPQMRELPLTAQYAEGALGFDRNADFKTKDTDRLRCTTLGGKAGEPLFLSFQLQEESRTIPIPFELKLTLSWSEHGKDADEPQQLANLLDWSLERVYPSQEQTSSRYPEIELVKAVADAQGRFVIAATAHWPHAAGQAAWQAYRLCGRFKRDAEPSWINQWSTPRDVTPAAGSRTLDLRTTLLGLWRNPVLEKQPVAEAYLRIGPM